MKTIKCNVYNYPGLKPLIVANYKKGEMATFLDMDKDVPYGFHTVVLRIEDHAGSNNIRYAELVEVVGMLDHLCIWAKPLMLCGLLLDMMGVLLREN